MHAGRSRIKPAAGVLTTAGKRVQQPPVHMAARCLMQQRVQRLRLRQYLVFGPPIAPDRQGQVVPR